MTRRLKDNEFQIIAGAIEKDLWTLIDDTFTNGEKAIPVDKLFSCVLVRDEHTISQSGVGRLAGGIIGGTLLGPIGALAGLLGGGRKKIDETIIRCELDDRRSFVAHSTQIGAASLIAIAQRNSSANTSKVNLAAQSATTVIDNLVECTQCAELIQPKAIICRYCGADRVAAILPVAAIEGNMPTDEHSIPGAYERFIKDYRAQVLDSPFSSDFAIYQIITQITLALKEIPSVGIDEVRSELAEKRDVRKGHIEKIASNIWLIDNLIKEYSKKYPPESIYGDISREEFILLLENLSERSLSEKHNPENSEQHAKDILSSVQKALVQRKEKVLQVRNAIAFLNFIPSRMLLNRFYILDDAAVAIDYDARSKKIKDIKKSAMAKLSSTQKSVLKSSDYIEWFKSFMDEAIPPENAIKFYRGYCNILKLYENINIYEDSLQDTIGEVIYKMQQDAKGNSGQISLDQWISRNLEMVAVMFSEPGIAEKEECIRAFNEGFNSI